jgi:hypothetical protein
VRCWTSGRTGQGCDGPTWATGAILLTRETTAREDPALFTAAVEAVRLSLDNARLTARVRSQLAEVEASRARITTAADEARHKLERDLHDGAQQQLLGLGMSLVAARRAVPDDSPAATRLDEASAQLKDSLVELRQLSRGLRPALLAERGLEVALDDLRRRIPVPLSVRVDLLERPAPPIEVTAYYVLAESLQNITRPRPRSDRHGHRPGNRAGPGGQRERRRTRRRGRVPRQRAARTQRPGARRRRRARRGQPHRRRDHRHRPAAPASRDGDPMTPRIVIADDSLIVRAGLRNLLTEEGMDVVDAVADADALMPRSRSPTRTWRSSTSGCPPPTPTRACWPSSGSAPSTPGRPPCCCRSTSKRPTSWNSWRATAPTSATC